MQENFQAAGADDARILQIFPDPIADGDRGLLSFHKQHTTVLGPSGIELRPFRPFVLPIGTEPLPGLCPHTPV